MMANYLGALSRAVENSLGSHLSQDEAAELITNLFELVELREAVQRVRELHVNDQGRCRECTHEPATYGLDYETIYWPCPTLRALDAAPDAS